MSFKEEQKVISSENPKPYTPIFRVLNSEKKKFFFLFLRRKKDDITQTKAVPSLFTPPRRGGHTISGGKKQNVDTLTAHCALERGGEDDDALNFDGVIICAWDPQNIQST